MKRLNTIMGLAVCLWLAMAGSVAAQPIAPGLYYDPAHDGHGFDLQSATGRWILVFYTYDDANQPEWYLGVLEESRPGRLEGRIDRFDYRSDRSPPQQATGEGGEVVVDFEAGCETGAARFDWQLTGQSGRWCVRTLLGQDESPAEDYTALWYDPGDVGWGLSIDVQGGASSAAEVQVLFYYDALGQPRWALGITESPGATAQAELFNFVGYCRTCPPVPLLAESAGTLGHDFSVVDGWPQGQIELDLAYALEGGGRWDRSTRIEPLSDSARGLIPVPDRVDEDRSVVITDVTVVPMTGPDPRLDHHTVIIDDGLIQALGPAGSLALPDDAIRVDGRDRYLGPGLSEMHLHISFGGQVPAEEAGLLMLANGVTTALNMGDSFNVDVPMLGRRFALGLETGPTMYAGQVAYGPSDNADPPRTIRSTAEATAYVDRIEAEGYDYIKVYWGLEPSVIDQFANESRQRGLPIIGHIPRTQRSRASFMDGHRMAAHVQEPWITFLNQAYDESLLQPAAEEFLEFGVYLTPTLAVFESYTSIYGGDQEAFDALIEREGYTVTHPLVRNGWRTYFNSTSIQGNGQVPGGLDDQFQFFIRLTQAFHEAGVPLLVGTDAPGFPGVMSGFGAHREHELFQLAGLTPEEIYHAATVNAGQFVQDTLGGVPFGTIESGHRADLILTESDPLAAVENLRRPLVVISRGRLYSQASLQVELDALARRNGFGKSGQGHPLPEVDVGMPYCSEDLRW